MGAEYSVQPEQAAPPPGAPGRDALLHTLLVNGPDGGVGPPFVPGTHQHQLHSMPVNLASLVPTPATSKPTTLPNLAIGGFQTGEGVLLTQLVQLLSQRPRHSLLLSDLGALLPPDLRSVVKEKGGLRSWLQKHPMLFVVSGLPSKESVTLTLGGNANPDSSGGLQAEDRQGMPPGAGDRKYDQAKKEEEEEDTASCAQLRGLPYRATVSDVKIFLGRHAAFLKDEHAIQLVLNRDGRPSGFARVRFKNPAAAIAARDELHTLRMSTANQDSGASQDRYVEVFLYSERPNKLKFRKGPVVCDGTQGEEEPDIQGASKEQVIQECRSHMNSPGKSQLLLSMLGVVLSAAARHYLKKTDLGLKHVLAQYPQEFSVEGAKGRECITYLPAMPASYTVNTTPNMGPPAPSTATQATSQSLGATDSGKGWKQQRASKGTPGPATGNINDLAHNSTVEDMPFGLTSPLHMPISPGVAVRAMATPSDWGSPTPYEAWELPRKSRSTETPTNLPSDNFAHGQTPNVFDTPNWAAWGMQPWGAMTLPTGMLPCGNGVGQVPPPVLQLDNHNQLGGGFTPTMAELLAVLASSAIQQPSWMQLPVMQPPGVQHLGMNPPEDEGSTVGLRLRGLPFNCNEQDIFAFFAKHGVVEQIADVSKVVTMVLKPNGKSSGHAIVEMTSSEAAEEARKHLNGQWMGTRYIEVFYNSEFEKNEGDGYNASPNPTIRNNEPMEIASVSDTGGSGGMTAMMVPPSPNASPMPGSWHPGQQTPSSPWGSSPSPTGHIDSLKALANASRNQAMARSAGGTGGETMLKDQGESSWEALFDFLKKDHQPTTTTTTNLRTLSM